jgi:hypothetical protein
MPRLDLRLTLAQALRPTEHALALTLLAWVNEVRAAAGLPARTELDLARDVLHWLHLGPDARPPEEEA